jgi:hypothetical protein
VRLIRARAAGEAAGAASGVAPAADAAGAAAAAGTAARVVYAIAYDDGDEEEDVPAKYVRPLVEGEEAGDKPPATDGTPPPAGAAAAAADASGGAAAPAPARAPAPAPSPRPPPPPPAFVIGEEVEALFPDAGGEWRRAVVLHVAAPPAPLPAEAGGGALADDRLPTALTLPR